MQDMNELREAILEMLAETIGETGEMTEEQVAVVNAWNRVCDASPTVGIPAPIAEEDLEPYFEG